MSRPADDRSRSGPRLVRPAAPPPAGDIIHNNTSTDLDCGYILGFTSRSPAGVLQGGQPTAAHAGRFAVLLEPIRAGGQGRAAVSGLVEAWTVGPDADYPAHSYAEVDPDPEEGYEFTLRVGAAGSARVYVRDVHTTGGTLYRSLVMLGQPKNAVYFRLKESYYPGDGFAFNNHTRAAYAYGEWDEDMPHSEVLCPIDVLFPMSGPSCLRRSIGLGEDDLVVGLSCGLAIRDGTGRYRVGSLWPQRWTAKIQSAWTANVNGPQDVEVPVKLAPTGVEVANAFSAYLRVPDGTASALYPTGQNDGLVELEVDCDGKVRIVSPATDRKIGTIELWFGSTASIGKGWRFCNGENGTPDLRDRFVMGSGTIGATGGYAKHGPSENNHTDHAEHRHLPLVSDSYWFTPGETELVVPWSMPFHPALAHSETDNRPPYYTLAYIMRVADVT